MKRILLPFLVFLFVLQFSYIVLLKWVDPPTTWTQFQSLKQGRGVTRYQIKFSQIPARVRLAVLAGEDTRYLWHHGIDRRSLLKNIRRLRKGLPFRGASTISQQTAKNVFLWQGGGWVRKGLEAYFAIMIELLWGKERIFEVYVNVIETGNGLFGIEAAAQKYFHKSVSALTFKEAAMLVASFPNPKKYTVVPLSKYVAWRTPRIMYRMKILNRYYPEVRRFIYPAFFKTAPR